MALTHWSVLPYDPTIPATQAISMTESLLTLNQARIRWERGTDGSAVGWPLRSYSDRHWRSVLVRDEMAPAAGAARYRTRWDARYIGPLATTKQSEDGSASTKRGEDGLVAAKRSEDGLVAAKRSEDGPTQTTVSADDPTATQPAGTSFTVRTKFLLSPSQYVPRGWLAVICEAPFEVHINNLRRYPGKGSRLPQRFELRDLIPGENTLAIRSSGPVVLAEGEYLPAPDVTVPLFTHTGWEASRDEHTWTAAVEFGGPPEGPIGEPPYPRERLEPSTVWYRITLPPGTTALRPSIHEGMLQAWYRNPPLRLDPAGWTTLTSAATGGLLALQVRIAPDQRGCIEPWQARCRPVPMSSAWAAMDPAVLAAMRLRCRATVEMPADLLAGSAWMLSLPPELGPIEAWLNGVLIGLSRDTDHTIDLTAGLQEGINTLDLILQPALADAAWPAILQGEAEQITSAILWLPAAK